MQDSAAEPIFRLDPQALAFPASPFSDWLQRIAENLAGLGGLEDLYNRISGGDGRLEFLKRAERELGVETKVPPADLGRIPKRGPVVMVANHPFGALEGVLLARLLLEVRPDVKIMANYLLSRVPELRDMFIFVDPFDSVHSVENNLKPLRESIAWLENGGLLLVFPAGEVSHLSWSKREVREAPWSAVAAGLARRTRAPAVSIHIAGRNGALFQAAGLLHPRLRSALLPRELINKKGRTVNIRIGNPITYKQLARYQNAREATGFLKRRNYLLALSQRQAGDSPAAVAKQRPAAPGACRSLGAAAEVSSLPREQILTESGNFQVLCASRQQIPSLVEEVGRVRELCFRRVGEGTGRERDLDRFDDYYLHLCLWDRKEQVLAGGYRLGQADKIVANLGVQGLYTSTLFRFKPEFFQNFRPALELGRSFVHPTYQRSYSGLMLLWKGIGLFVARHPQYRFLFGPVSVSNAYTPLSRWLIMKFLNKRHASPLTPLVRAVTPPRFASGSDIRLQSLVNELENVEELSNLVSEVEPSGWGVPIMLKQYLKLAAKAVAWNVDPGFGHVLDCLMAANLLDSDARSLQRYMGKPGAEAFHKHHLEQSGKLMRCA